MRYKQKGLSTWDLVIGAFPKAFSKMLSYRSLLQNPTLFVVFCVNVLLSITLFVEWVQGSSQLFYHTLLICSLWMTSLFANFSEAIAEGRGKAQASSLRSLQSDTLANKIEGDSYGCPTQQVRSSDLQVGDLVLVSKGDTVPCDGEAVEGIALVDESAVTGESAPVVREAGGDVSALTGGTVILSDWVVMKVSARSGEGFLERMIQLVEGAKRRKTPNEKALHAVLAGFTLVFLIVVGTLSPLFETTAFFLGVDLPLDPFISIALLVCLMPTTIGALLPAISIAGMDRMVRHNVLALTPRAVEAAGDVDTLLLDKTGTITLGNRQAAEFFPAFGVSMEELVEAALIASFSDETAEGKSIVALARETYGCATEFETDHWRCIPFTAKTRMSGVDVGDERYRKGALDAIEAMLREKGGEVPEGIREEVAKISRKGGTPLVVSRGYRVVGAIFLKDIVKPGLKRRFAKLRQMGIRTVMVTGDNQLTAAAIAAEAGVDDCYGQVTPEQKLRIIEQYQRDGHMVAMTGDGSNDAPALAKADVSMAMNSGTQAAREAANLIDLDSNPTKLIEAVGIGKQLLMTRGALTTFSIANDVAKYFVLLPVVFLPLCPQLALFNKMNLFSSSTACLSCVLFNALVILALVPLALKGVRYTPIDASRLFCRNLCFWGTLGLVIPFFGIKMIDLIISSFLLG